MIFSFKPSTKSLMVLLRKARIIELSKTGRNICVADDFKGALSVLCKRGFVNTRMVLQDGKEIISVYVTQAGKFLLDQYERREGSKMGNVYNIS